MSDIFSTLREQALRKTADRPEEDFVVRGLWKIDLRFRPNVHERIFNYSVMLAQTLGQGCSYCSPAACLDDDVIGKDAREIVAQKSCRNIAILDSIYSTIVRRPQETHEFRGTSVEKADRRNRIIVEETERLLQSFGSTAPRVVNVGVVGNVIRQIRERGYQVLATDFDETIIGTSFQGVTVESGTKTLDFVKNCEVAIVTGMTLSTDSLDEIVDVAHQHGTRLLLFAETGANFGEEYCRTIGIDAVVSEPFPFYIFQGVSTIEVYRKA